MLAVLFAESGPVLAVAASTLFLLWLITLFQAFRYAVVPSRFVRAQRSLLTRIFDSDAFWKMCALEDRVKNPELVKLDREQLTAVLTRASTGLVAYRAGHLWAYELDRYRRSGASILFSAASVATLVVQGVITFTLVNCALYKVQPGQFAFDRAPSFATFIYYSFNSIFVSEISALRPVGDLASLVQVAAGFTCAVLVVLLVVTLVFSFRHSRTDKAATKAIRQMRRRSEQFATKLSEEYETTLDELLRRLDEMGSGLLTVISYLSSQVPDDDDRDEAA